MKKVFLTVVTHLVVLDDDLNELEIATASLGGVVDAIRKVELDQQFRNDQQ